MKTEPEQPKYQSYLLRLWQVDDYNVPQTRITLIQVASGQKQTFTNLEELASYLEQSSQK